MARTRDRVFALTLAVIFFAVSFGTSFFVIWQLYSNSKEAKNVNQQTNASTDAANKEDTNVDDSQKSAQQLQGTKLQNFTPVSQIDTLKAEDTKPGTGSEVKSGDTVTVDYTGAVASTGVIFQSSLDAGKPVSFSLSGVIKGWTDGVPGMKEGGTRRLYIPASQAYGANPPQGSGIPANADLVFDITLHKIGQ
jgi:FKBP-type peptidyl-prolyl cis-trans isomerase